MDDVILERVICMEFPARLAKEKMFRFGSLLDDGDCWLLDPEASVHAHYLVGNVTGLHP